MRRQARIAVKPRLGFCNDAKVRRVSSAVFVPCAPLLSRGQSASPSPPSPPPPPPPPPSNLLRIRPTHAHTHTHTHTHTHSGTRSSERWLQRKPRARARKLQPPPRCTKDSHATLQASRRSSDRVIINGAQTTTFALRNSQRFQRRNKRSTTLSSRLERRLFGRLRKTRVRRKKRQLPL